VGEAWMKHNEMTADNGQVFPADPSVKFKIKSPAIFTGDYGTTASMNSKGVDVNGFNFGPNTNNSGGKILIGIEKMIEQFPSVVFISPQKKPPSKNIPVNVSTNNPANIVGEKTIINYSMLNQLRGMFGSQDGENGVVVNNNYILYFDDQDVSANYAYEEWINPGTFLQNRHIKLNGTEVVLFGQLPAGKQGFEWRETGGKSKSKWHITQPPKSNNNGF
jgi:hypothetical protein